LAGARPLPSVSLGAELHKVLGEKRKHAVNSAVVTGVEAGAVKKTKMNETTSPVKIERQQLEQSPSDSKKVRIGEFVQGWRVNRKEIFCVILLE
jgi:hypothetical protein